MTLIELDEEAVGVQVGQEVAEEVQRLVVLEPDAEGNMTNQGAAPPAQQPHSGDGRSNEGELTPAQEPPVTTAGTDGTEQESSNVTGDQEQTSKDAGPTRRAKRGRAPSGGSDNDQSKKQKTNVEPDGDREGEDQIDQTTQPDPDAPCLRLRRRLREWEAGASGDEADVAPYMSGRMLEDSDVYRGITAVTEGIVQGGGHLFSVIDPNALQNEWDPGNLVQTIARPRQEILVPRVFEGHISLNAVLPNDPAESAGQQNGFRLLHFDSARRGHRGQIWEPAMTRWVRERLTENRWNGHEGGEDDEGNSFDITGYVEAPNVARQEQGWECGLHVIFNAWAHALALRLSGGPIASYSGFLRDGIAIVRAAVQGRVASDDILAFFDCYRFVQPGQQIGADRVFEHTLRLARGDDLMAHVARVRVVEDLEIMRERGTLPEWFLDFATAYDDLQAPDLTTMTAQGFVDAFMALQRAAHPPSDPPGATLDEGRTPQNSAGSNSSAFARELAGTSGFQEQEELLEMARRDSGMRTGEGSGPVSGEQTLQTDARQLPNDTSQDAAGARNSSSPHDSSMDPRAPGPASTTNQPPNNASHEQQNNQSSTTGATNGTSAAAPPHVTGQQPGNRTSATTSRFPVPASLQNNTVPSAQAVFDSLSQGIVPGTEDHRERAAARADHKNPQNGSHVAQGYIDGARRSADRIPPLAETAGSGAATTTEEHVGGADEGSSGAAGDGGAPGEEGNNEENEEQTARDEDRDGVVEDNGSEDHDDGGAGALGDGGAAGEGGSGQGIDQDYNGQGDRRDDGAEEDNAEGDQDNSGGGEQHRNENENDDLYNDLFGESEDASSSDGSSSPPSPPPAPPPRGSIHESLLPHIGGSDDLPDYEEEDQEPPAHRQSLRDRLLGQTGGPRNTLRLDDEENEEEAPPELTLDQIIARDRARRSSEGSLSSQLLDALNNGDDAPARTPPRDPPSGTATESGWNRDMADMLLDLSPGTGAAVRRDMELTAATLGRSVGGVAPSSTQQQQQPSGWQGEFDGGDDELDYGDEQFGDDDDDDDHDNFYV
ncbi:hypothetical protein LTR37_009006 [Vermiconidia calcicola]|uniref:Uncharacterized protein n=1 Tax=Vermiconidia calcicola TaxID=1690605 RepID=A0ACC3NAJ8_9PEZI|nr:hypothetical protein LTR37_009006 [Vermiconidia calcicola]